jgi:hypothetical protein
MQVTETTENHSPYISLLHLYSVQCGVEGGKKEILCDLLFTTVEADSELGISPCTIT